MSASSAVRARLITNPNSGRGGIDLMTVLPTLEAHGWEVDVCPTEQAGHATELAREAAHAGVNVVIACGGDGTLGETVDGVIGSDAAVGVLPGGTANLWAQEVGISKDLYLATLQLIGAQRRRIDVGRVAINGMAEQHFLLMAGLGLDAAVVAGLSDELKARVGMFAYAPAIFNAVRHASRIHMSVELDEVVWEGDVAQLIVGNTRRYASVTSVTPDAFVDDGRLDVCLLTPSTFPAIARQLGSLLVRRRPDQKSSVSDRVGQVSVRAPGVTALQLRSPRTMSRPAPAVCSTSSRSSRRRSPCSSLARTTARCFRPARWRRSPNCPKSALAAPLTLTSCAWSQSALTRSPPLETTGKLSPCGCPKRRRRWMHPARIRRCPRSWPC